MKRHGFLLFVCIIILILCVCLSSATSVESILDFQKYTNGQDLSSTSDLGDWTLSNPTGGSGVLSVQEEVGNRYLQGTTYFQLKHNTVIKTASVLEFDIQRTGTAQLMACVKSGEEIFTFQNGLPSNLYEKDGAQWSHGGSGIIFEFADYDITMRIKTVDDAQINGIANKGIEFRCSYTEPFFNNAMRHIKIEDSGSTVKIYVNGGLIWTIELSEPGSYSTAKIAAQETYYKKAVVKDSSNNQVLSVDNAFVSINNTVMFASDATGFKLDNVSLKYDDGKNVVYKGSQIRKTLTPMKISEGNYNNADMRQGLRFCFDMAEINSEIISSGETYRVIGQGALVILNSNLTDESQMIVGGTLTKLQQQTELVDWIVGDDTYKSAYVYNIPKEHKDKSISVRAYVKCLNSLNETVYLYSSIQTDSLDSVYSRMDSVGKEEMSVEAKAWWIS